MPTTCIACRDQNAGCASVGGRAADDRRTKRINNEFGAQVVGDRPADDHPGPKKQGLNVNARGRIPAEIVEKPLRSFRPV